MLSIKVAMANRKVRTLKPSDQIEAWYLAYRHDVYNFFVYFTGSLDVDDLVQQTFLNALKGVGSYKATASPKTWLFAIARNVALDARRKRTAPVSDNDFNDLQDDGLSPEDLASANESARVVMDVLNQLKPQHRMILILRGIQELSGGEAAHVLGWTRSRVNVAYHRALKEARKLMTTQPEYLELSFAHAGQIKEGVDR